MLPVLIRTTRALQTRECTADQTDRGVIRNAVTLGALPLPVMLDQAVEDV